jgi:hypothetical protein
MSVDRRIALNLDDLPMDVFELANQGLEVESLTAGHGMTQWRPLAAQTPPAVASPAPAAVVHHEFGDPRPLVLRVARLAS